MSERPYWHNPDDGRRYDWVFSHRHTAGVLCFINDNGKVMVKDLLMVCTSHRSLMRALDELMECGLVMMIVRDRDHMAKIYSVTDKGRDIARRLNEIRRIVDGHMPPVRGVPPIENY